MHCPNFDSESPKVVNGFQGVRRVRTRSPVVKEFLLLFDVPPSVDPL